MALSSWERILALDLCSWPGYVTIKASSSFEECEFMSERQENFTVPSPKIHPVLCQWSFKMGSCLLPAPAISFAGSLQMLVLSVGWTCCEYTKSVTSSGKSSALRLTLHLGQRRHKRDALQFLGLVAKRQLSDPRGWWYNPRLRDQCCTSQENYIPKHNAEMEEPFNSCDSHLVQGATAEGALEGPHCF